MKPLNTLGLLATFGTAALLVTTASAWSSDDAAPQPAKAAGAIKGRIEFEGEKPELKPFQITAEAAKGCCPEGVSVDAADQSLLIDDKGGVANVVVTLTVEGVKPTVPAEPVELDQKHCHFEPHVIVVPVGGKMAFLNSDEVSHNIHTYPVKSTGINQMVSAHGSLPQAFDKTETIKAACDIHTWMSSYIIVTDASAWAVSKPDGTFEISLADLKPGKYTLEMWHEKLGKNKQEITVADDGSCDAGTIKWSMEKKDSRRRGK
jgi:plastocyanin